MANRIFHSQLRKEKIMSDFFRNKYEYLKHLGTKFIRGVLEVHEQDLKQYELSEEPEVAELHLVYTWILSNLAIRATTLKEVSFWFVVFPHGMCINSAFIQAGADFYYPYFTKSKDELMKVVYQCLSDMNKNIPELEYNHTHSADASDSFCITLKSIE